MSKHDRTEETGAVFVMRIFQGRVGIVRFVRGPGAGGRKRNSSLCWHCRKPREPPRWRFSTSHVLPGVGGGNVAREFAERFYKSKAWRDCRDAYFIYRHGLCERCGRPGAIVHHRIYLTPQNINDPNVSLNWENLELTCQDCHNNEHHGTEAVAEGMRFDENGDLIKK